MTPEQRALNRTRAVWELAEDDWWTDERVRQLTAYHANLVREHMKDIVIGLWTYLTGGFKR